MPVIAKELPSLSIVTFKDEPLNRETPLKFCVATLLMYAANWEYSAWYCVRSVSDFVTSCDWMANWLIWLRALPTWPRKPVCVWLYEFASAMLLFAAETRLISAFKRNATALPAGSSAGLVI